MNLRFLTGSREGKARTAVVIPLRFPGALAATRVNTTASRVACVAGAIGLLEPILAIKTARRADGQPEEVLSAFSPAEEQQLQVFLRSLSADGDGSEPLPQIAGLRDLAELVRAPLHGVGRAVAALLADDDGDSSALKTLAAKWVAGIDAPLLERAGRSAVRIQRLALLSTVAETEDGVSPDPSLAKRTSPQTTSAGAAKRASRSSSRAGGDSPAAQ